MNALEQMQKLRRDGDLQGARRRGEEILAAGNDSTELIELLADIYLDIEAECMRTGVTSFISEIDSRLDELLSQLPGAGRIASRHKAIQISALPNYADIMRFEELSHHDGKEEEAYHGVRAFISQTPVDPRLHETVALILYRHLRADYTRIGSRESRRLLADYLGLAVPKPSRVHSLILRMAVRVARRYDDFNFARFLRLWNPRTLRPDDISPHGIDGRPLPSLAMAAIARVIDSPQVAEFPDLLQMIPATAEVRLAVLRDTFFNLVSNACKQGDHDTAAEMLRLYSLHASMHTASARHSDMLALALKVLRDERAWRFPEFFVAWDCFFLRKADFSTTTSRTTGRTIPSLASRAMARCFSVIKNDIPRHSYLLPQVIRAFDTIAETMPGGPDELLELRRASMLAWSDCEDTALDRLCALATRPGDRSARFWLDFAEIAPSRQLKMGILALGIIKSQQAREDAEAASLRLSLAQLLHFEGNDDSASLELQLYTDEMSSLAAEPSARYGAIAATINPEAVMPPSNELLYHTLAAEALDTIYRRYPARRMCVIAADASNLLLSDGGQPPLNINIKQWPAVSRLKAGACVTVRLNNTGQTVAVRPYDDAPFAALPLHHGIVTSTSPLLIHCAGKPDAIAAETQAELTTGDTVAMRVYRDNSGRRCGLAVTQVPIARARSEFDHLSVAIFDRLPDGGALFSAGPDIEPGKIPPEFAAGQSDGEPFEIYFYRTADGERHVISTSEAIDPEGCKALKTVSGELNIKSDGSASVRDVHIPAELIAKAGISDRTYVTATAIYLPRRGAETPIWQAIAIDTYH